MPTTNPSVGVRLPTPFQGKPKTPLLPAHEVFAMWVAQHATMPRMRDELLPFLQALDPTATFKKMRMLLMRPDFQSLVRTFERARQQRPPEPASVVGVVTGQRLVPLAPDPIYNSENLHRTEPSEEQRALGWKSWREHIEQLVRESSAQRRI